MPNQVHPARKLSLADLLRPHVEGSSVLWRETDWFTFNAPVNFLVAPSLKDQKYLVILVRPADRQLPEDKTFEMLRDELKTTLVGPGVCVNGFWNEASQGRVSLIFDFVDRMIDLDQPYEEYYYYHSFMTIDADGGAFPVTWSGGETLELSGYNGNFTVSVTFSAGTQSLSEVVATINAAINSAYNTYNEPNKPTDPPLRAIENNCTGQLRIESLRPSPAGDIALLGGTAIALLGLNNSTITPEKPGVDNRHALFEEPLNKFVAGMSDAEAEQVLAQYRSVLVSVSGKCAGVWPDWLQDTFNIRGKSYTFGTIRVAYAYAWNVIAHEIGHDMTFPDLYEQKGVREVGEEPGPWCIMDNSYYSDSHPCAWLKAEKTHQSSNTEPGWNDPWIPASEMGTVSSPAPHRTESHVFLLAPSSCVLPSTNPFATLYPGVPLVRAVRVELEKTRYPTTGEVIVPHSLYVEAREEGPFSDSLFGTANYDTFDPANAVHGGVIVTDCVSDPGMVMRSNVVLITPKFLPITQAGDEAPQEYTDGESKITVRCKDIVYRHPSIYLMEVEWGPGYGTFDLRIDPWQPPPYESPDIWIDTRVDNEWDVYSHSNPMRNPSVPGHPVGNGDRSRVNWESRVYARVWNDGDRPVNNVVVDFKIVVPAGSGPGVDIGTATIPEILPGESRLAMVTWTPRQEPKPESHVCIKAIIHHQDGELNANNNTAQENVTDWYLEGGSPYTPIELEFQVQNPLPQRAPFRMGVQGLRPGFHVDVKPVEFWLEAGEIMYGKARIWADATVPFEESFSLTHQTLPAPLISLEWRTSTGCAWRAIGGISGWAHPVRKAQVNAEVTLRLNARIQREVLLLAKATAAEKPVQHANISVRVSDTNGSTILITHAVTDGNGRAQLSIVLPDGFPLENEYRAEVVLSPTIGIGPSSTELRFRFPQ